MALKVCMLLY